MQARALVVFLKRDRDLISTATNKTAALGTKYL